MTDFALETQYARNIQNFKKDCQNAKNNLISNRTKLKSLTLHIKTF